MRTPAPAAYSLPPTLRYSPKGGSDGTFGAPREAYKKLYFEHKPNVDLAVPGPGSYKPPETVGKEGTKWSMGVRLGIFFVCVPRSETHLTQTINYRN